MQIKPVGLTGALISFPSVISDDNADRIAVLVDAIVKAHIPGMIELVPAFASLYVRYTPMETDFSAVSAAIEAVSGTDATDMTHNGKTVEIPVCYGGDYGPDLSFVASHSGLSQEEVIRIHSGHPYRIHMLGFLPGFPYLGGLDPRLHTPRLASPRSQIPAGSVGIGGSQTGVYPMASPGGWQLIGRTPRTLFVPGRPLPYQSGDWIRFVPITETEYAALEADT